MKIPQLFRHKKFMAATARRASSATAGMDFEDIPEPNMKLSRALLIVLLLHVVAVSGIIAFNAIKERESSFPPVIPTSSQNSAVNAPSPVVEMEAGKPRVSASHKEAPPRSDPKPSHSASKEEHTRSVVASGQSYTVKKGDNPVLIAKKFKVSYDDLIALNDIKDPHKLRIGHKLLIPKRANQKKDNN